MYCESMGDYGDSYPATITLEGNVYLHDTGYVDVLRSTWQILVHQ